jgi:hypothetical protein
MSDNCSNTKHPLFRDGTSQQQRLLKALLPSFVSVDERSMDDLIAFAKKYAEEINFFDQNNSTNGNWVDFFTQEIDSSNKETEPHYALFIAFLDLFRVAQDDLNTITQRHLDFYYRDVLQLKEKAAVPDQVFMIFELAKQVTTGLIKKGASLNAGKDGKGQALTYTTDADLVINKATVQDLKTVFADKNNDYRIYASPIANSGDGYGSKLASDDPKWRTFGRKDFANLDQKQGDVGFAFSSPLLFMAEGKRLVTITLTFGQTVDIDTPLLANALKVQFSGEKKWIDPDPAFNKPIDLVIVSGNRITITRTVTEGQPAIVAYNAAKLGQPFSTAWPVMRVLLDTDKTNRYMYDKLKNLSLKKAQIDVDVQGVKNLTLFNDNSKLKSDKPFDPFTNRPLIGSSFYIGSTEVFSKNLNSVDVSITWHGLPTTRGGFKSYYHDYFPPDADRTNTGFMADISILDGRKWKDLGSQSLFDDKNNPVKPVSGNVAETAPPAGVIASGIVSTVRGPLIGILFPAVYPGLESGPVPAELRNIKITGGALTDVPRDPNMDPVTIVDGNTFKGFLKLELAKADFGHKDYAISLAHQINNVQKPVNLVNPPYTPSIKEISLSYTSSVTIGFSETATTFNDRLDLFYHIQPFGVMEIHPLLFLKPSSTLLSVVPQFNDEGSLYIGINALKPSQVLSVLFKVSDGSANPDLEKQPVIWSYMVNNQWVQFPKLKILSDGTSGLLASGIVSFDVPSEATNNNTILPIGLHWLKASVTDSSGAVCDLVDVRAQAVTATFIDNANDPEHLRLPLPASTIAKLRESNSRIPKVSQPFASFGGKVKEQSNDFYVRVSERLRHKHRAITLWDYERLALEKFPSVYKMKCITHTEDKPTNYSEIAPGHVTLIAVSNLRNKNVINPLQPKTSLTTLEEIHDYISSLTSWWVELDVRNPDFEEIRTTFNVRFLPGFDNGFYGQKLNEDIKKFLSPWAYEAAAEISFGGHIHRSTLINFVEQQEYVDFVSCFRMDQINGAQILTDIEEAVTTTAASVLVSSTNHLITVLETDDCACKDNIQTNQIMPADDVSCDVKAPEPPQRGIGSDVVNGNFIVGFSASQSGIDFFEIENDFNVS